MNRTSHWMFVRIRYKDTARALPATARVKLQPVTKNAGVMTSIISAATANQVFCSVEVVFAACMLRYSALLIEKMEFKNE